jgi:phosphatidylserine decarboxylase
MSIEVNGQVFESIEDYEKNYVVASMDIEGLGEQPGSFFKNGSTMKDVKPTGEMINKTQMRYAVAGAMKAGFLVITIFGGSIVGFILLLQLVW